MGSWRRAVAWTAALGVLGAVLVAVFPDSYQQDGGQHYLFARWAFRLPHYFVKVWARPLFMLVYAPATQLGYSPAQLVTVLVCLVTSWHTFRLAEELGLARPHLTVPLLWFQPSWLLLSHELMTEPLFALVFVLALRLHLSGRVMAGVGVASLMPLARPEGFFLGILWGVWLLIDRRDSRPVWKRLPSTLLLLSGCALWWLAAYLLTRDPLFILHDWPRDWHATAAEYGFEPVWSYILRLPELVGPLLLVPFLLGLSLLLRRRQLGTATSAFLVLFVLHSVLHTFGLFGSAGYPRYLVCVAPATALITLVGWNLLADWLSRFSRPRMAWLVGSLVLVPSALAALLYVDAAQWARDAWAVDATVARFREEPRPVARFYGSQRYMNIVFDDGAQEPRLGQDRERNLQILREAPPATLVMWDAQRGPDWFRLEVKDLEALGYTLLRSDEYVLTGKLLNRSPGPWFDYGYGPLVRYGWRWHGFGGPHSVHLFLLYKER
ncbi:hypothetical protein [Hyalangium versicolor]|uniref:hypothetical protein n=1 Tax=Hyalangium versicolor TaxID=2861190 RepID=UPI001CCA58FD|nr:hypothetical protein [Hyalangium versicolor]